MKSQFSSTCVNLPRTAFTHLLVFTIAALVCELGGRIPLSVVFNFRPDIVTGPRLQ